MADAWESVLESIRTAILNGVYSPRERLIESELSARFAASRFNIRKALAQLSAEGLVEIQPNKGARVKEISVDEAIEITELRAAIEAIVAAKAAERATDADISLLRSLALKMQESVRNFNLVTYSDANLDFHNTVRRIAGHTPAMQLLEQLHGQIVQHQFMLGLIPGRPEIAMNEHLAIIDAIESRDPKAAEYAMKMHIESIIGALETFRDGRTSSNAGIRELSRKAAPSVMHQTLKLDPNVTVPYADKSPSQVLDLYLPENFQGPRPLVVSIHGGAFMMGDRTWETFAVPRLLERGYAVASLEYRLSGEALFPAAVQDVKRAVSFLRKNAALWNLDASFIATWGRSAGGYLAAMLGVTGDLKTDFDSEGDDSRVSAVVDWYGPSDFLLMDEQFRVSPPTGQGPAVQVHDDPESPESKFLGGPIQDLKDQAQEANPISYIGKGNSIPPFYISAGTNDRLVPHQQSEILASALKKNHSDVILKMLKDASHADHRFEAELTEPVIDWLDSLRVSN